MALEQSPVHPISTHPPLSCPCPCPSTGQETKQWGRGTHRLGERQTPPVSCSVGHLLSIHCKPSLTPLHTPILIISLTVSAQPSHLGRRRKNQIPEPHFLGLEYKEGSKPKKNRKERLLVKQSSLLLLRDPLCSTWNYIFSDTRITSFARL